MSPVGVQNIDLLHKVPIGALQNRAELISYAFLLFIIHILIIQVLVCIDHTVELSNFNFMYTTYKYLLA